MEIYHLIGDEIKIKDVDYKKIKEFNYKGEDYILIRGKKVWKKMILQKQNELEYTDVEDKELLNEIIKENFVQSPDLVF